MDKPKRQIRVGLQYQSLLLRFLWSLHHVVPVFSRTPTKSRAQATISSAKNQRNPRKNYGPEQKIAARMHQSEVVVKRASEDLHRGYEELQSLMGYLRFLSNGCANTRLPRQFQCDIGGHTFQLTVDRTCGRWKRRHGGRKCPLHSFRLPLTVPLVFMRILGLIFPLLNHSRVCLLLRALWWWSENTCIVGGENKSSGQCEKMSYIL